MWEQNCLLAARKLLLLRATNARLLASFQPAGAETGPLLHSSSSSSSSASRALSTWQQQGPQQGLKSTAPADRQPCTAGGSAALQPAPRQTNSSSNGKCSSSSNPSTCSNKAAKNAAGDKPFQEQRLQWQQQAPQTWQQQQQVLPCSATHGHDLSQPDQQCYQGPAGGVVTLPKQGTPLWQATFNGNVPTHWWQQHGKASCTDHTQSNATTSSSSCGSSGSIGSWEHLVQRSPVISSSFKLKEGPPAAISWESVVLASLQLNGMYKPPGRAGPPCPRPMPPRVARLRLQHQLTPLLPHTVQGVRSAYAYNRHRLVRGRHSRQQQQQQQQQQGVPPQHWQQRRFSLRSRAYLAAAAAALHANKQNRRPPWRPRHSSTEEEAAAALAPDVVLSGVGPADDVPPIIGQATLMAAQQYAASAGAATRCVARQDDSGQLLPLPQGCTAAGSACSSCSVGVVASAAHAAEAVGGPPQWPNSSIESAAQRAGRTRKGVGRRLNDWQQQCDTQAASSVVAVACGIDTDAAAVAAGMWECLQTQQQQLADDAVAASLHEGEAAGDSQPTWWCISPADASAETDVAADDDSEDDGDDMNYESDDDEDDEDEFSQRTQAAEYGLVELAPSLLDHLRQLHTFRSSSDVLYGFWGVCPLG